MSSTLIFTIILLLLSICGIQSEVPPPVEKLFASNNNIKVLSDETYMYLLTRTGLQYRIENYLISDIYLNNGLTPLVPVSQQIICNPCSSSDSQPQSMYLKAPYIYILTSQKIIQKSFDDTTVNNAIVYSDYEVAYPSMVIDEANQNGFVLVGGENNDLRIGKFQFVDGVPQAVSESISTGNSLSSLSMPLDILFDDASGIGFYLQPNGVLTSFFSIPFQLTNLQTTFNFYTISNYFIYNSQLHLFGPSSTDPTSSFTWNVYVISGGTLTLSKYIPMPNLPTVTMAFDIAQSQLEIIGYSGTSYNVLNILIRPSDSDYVDTDIVAFTPQFSIDAPSNLLNGIILQYNGISAIGYINNNLLSMVWYNNLCTDNCNNNGLCITNNNGDHQCSCTDKFYGTTCGISVPTISQVIEVGVYSGDQITIIGTNFLNILGVEMNQLSCEIDPTKSNPTRLVIDYPPTLNFTLENEYYLVVIVQSGTAASVHTYFGFELPQITLVEQNENGELTVNGINLPPNGYNITINGTEVNYSYVSSDELTILTPTNFKGPISIKIECSLCPSGDQQATLKPYINSLTPSVIKVVPTDVAFEIFYAEDTVTIVQSTRGFQTNSTKQQDGLYHFKTTGFAYEDNLSFYAIGTYGESINICNYTYVNPSINSVEVLQDDQVQVRMLNIDTVTSNYAVTFNTNFDTPINGTINSILYNNTTTYYDIISSIPDSAHSSQIEVLIGLNSVLSSTVEIKPEIISITPNPSVNGEDVTITGKHFFGSVSVHPNQGTEYEPDCEVQEEGTLITCEILSGSGSFQLKMYSDTLGYTFNTSYHVPVIDSITPSQVELSTNYTFTISGSNFVNVAFSATIYGQECVILDTVSESSFQCNFTTPSVVPDSGSLLKVAVSSDGLQGFKSLLQLLQKCPKGMNDIQCGDKGTCDRIYGKCQCNSGYSGDTCEISDTINSSDLNNTEDDSKSSSKAGMIAGIVVGVSAAVALALVGYFVIYKKGIYKNIFSKKNPNRFRDDF
ncbi:hypothetical protein DLAC_06437 [Tieghemostelium lacteum]|uniref:EGF-like domain-containing protein n=1 Tax=Tieghemostelium lacteum TaxID=361077 RepID=A0A151ZF06_TIELA|nr:hypothetical protein DLAC_06437 [Tieghemostelium lacteum]|eukprot:KYQ92454.1 hypothetical protein DLAC_06437 [Tieghemostelium lacteum]